MADYWKSQAKKFCDFCKCWIADNKPSIEFHEKGKRHKESVSQRLSDIGKKSRKEHQNMLQVDEEMKKMEQAALKAYMKDVEANADFTSQVIKEQLAERQKKAAEKENEESSEVKKESEDGETDVDESKMKKPNVATKMWYEAESEQGYTYYWHQETGESIWEPPEEGYVSKAEQKETEEKEQKRKAKEEKLAQKKKEEEKKQRVEEERAHLEREKMRSRRVKEEKPAEPTEPAVAVFVGPAPKPDPYGGWQIVETRPTEHVDLQLPEQDFIEIKVPSLTEPKVKFKEKTVTTLGMEDEAGSSFKKRKFSSNPKRNMRQRLEDD